MSVASPTPWPQNSVIGAYGQPTFQARRPFSSSELLALRKKATEQALNASPVNTVNLQDSSEFTARVRKLASRDPDPIFETGRFGITLREPNPVMKGGGTIPNNTSANVLARQQGNVYAAAFFNYQPRQDYQSPGCATLLNDNVTFPKPIRCPPPQFRPAYHVVQPFSHSRRFGWRSNGKKVVFANRTPIPAAGQCGLTTLYPTL
jgi:hypothetical protein